MAYHQSNNGFGPVNNVAGNWFYLDPNAISNYDNLTAPQFMATGTDMETMDIFNELFEFESDFSLLEPQGNQQRLPMEGTPIPVEETSTTALVPANKKRPYSYADEPLETATIHNPKRSKKELGGYPCQQCGKSFDRAGDRRKHIQRTHMPEAERPCVCPQPGCVKRFHWMKDVVRHQRQIHGVTAPTGQKPVLQITTQAHAGNEDDDDDNDSDSKSTSRSDSRERSRSRPRRASEAPQTPAFKTMSGALAFSRSIVLLKGRIRLRRKTMSEASGRFIFVTSDESNFRVVDVRGLPGVQAVIKAIRKAMDVPDGHEVTIHRYNLGRGNGDLLDGEQLMSVVTKLADGLGTLKLHLTMVKKENENDEAGA